MDKQDKISIRMNGKETLIPREEEKAIEEVVTSQEEQAATAEVYEYEHAEQKKVIKPEAWKKHPYYKKKKRKKKLTSPVKNVIVSVVAALLLGLLLGFILLRMFVGITESDGATPSSTAPSTGDTENAAPVTTGRVTDINLSAVKAYVVQAGYFTSREKAEEWSENYIDEGYPTVIWEREGDVFLFTGLAGSYEAANAKASSLQADDLQTYVKPWEVAATEKVNIKGAEPLSGFADLFYATMDGKETTEEWNQLAGRLPENDTFKELKAAIKDLSESSDRSQQDVLLLKVWKGYENILKK
ncbi:SPOR domain-containing protein [Thalassobacillus devorans]|uniref:SPOR domain-containing protein n=1 Tax=Thalassobacillus devorans TaxID=279813 RepID=UPI00048E5262|nr:SPOR domain-containing protein [Thalassobacillus devorans]